MLDSASGGGGLLPGRGGGVWSRRVVSGRGVVVLVSGLGGSAPGGGCLVRGVCFPGGGVWSGGGVIPACTEADPLPPCEQNE